MPATFSSLPQELRDDIYGYALDRTPRTVEVEVRDGRVVSKTTPPALLSVRRDSREFVLKQYKPWLPQFAGQAAHAKYATLLAKYRHSKINTLSCLQDVYFDMERDTLLCRGSANMPDTENVWPLYLFGRIEESCLRHMAVNIFGSLNAQEVVACLAVAKNLKRLYFLDAEPHMPQMKKVMDGLIAYEKKGRHVRKVGVPKYVFPAFGATAPPSIFLANGGLEPSPREGIDTWAGVSFSTVETAIGLDSSAPLRNRTVFRHPATYSLPLTPPPEEETPSPPRPSSRKRKAEIWTETTFTVSHQAKRMKTWMKARELRKESLQKFGISPHRRVLNLNDWISQPKSSQRAGSSTAGASSSSPQSEAASSPPQSEDSSSAAHSEASSPRPHGDDGEESDSEDSKSESPESQEEEEDSASRTPKTIHAHRFNFDIGAPELLVEWKDSPEIETWEWVLQATLLHFVPVLVAAFIANNPALETGTPVRFHERNSGAVGFDFLVEFEGFPEEIYWAWVPESTMQARVPNLVDDWQSDAGSVKAAEKDEQSIDDQLMAEQNYAENTRIEVVKEEPVKEEESGKSEEPESEEEDEEDASEGYIPKRFVVQRETPDGAEILVEWEDWPDEKDWTWEPVSNLKEDAPEMLKAWKASRKAKKVSKIYEVESILGKRKIKGKWNYVVKWKGFSKEEDRSLEDCEQIKVDVPDLVEEFENRKPKRGRPKKAVA